MLNTWTDEKIAELAEGLRKFAGQTNVTMVDVPSLIEKLSQAPPNLRMSIVPAPDSSLPFASAEAEPETRHIRVRYETLAALNQNSPESRAIIVEEIGHVLMRHQGVRNHFVGVDFRARANRLVEKEEEDAKKFTWYCLAPFDVAIFSKSAVELELKFGLTKSNALEYFEHIQEHQRRLSKTPRSLPPNAVDYLTEAVKRGYTVKSIPTSQPEKAETPMVSRSGAKELSSRPLRDPDQEIAFLMKYENTPCPTCGHRKLRRNANCCQCQECGSSTSC